MGKQPVRISSRTTMKTSDYLRKGGRESAQSIAEKKKGIANTACKDVFRATMH